MQSLSTIYREKKNIGRQIEFSQIFGAFPFRFYAPEMAISKPMPLSWTKQREDIQRLRNLNALPIYGQELPADILGYRTFHGFQSLPSEIRLQIW